MKTLNRFLSVGLAALLFALSSCAIDQRFEFPEGPKGDPGLSAYEVWVEFIENGGDPAYEGGTEEGDFIIYIKGEKGEKGDTGETGEGTLPDIPTDFIYIDERTNTWVINGEDTGVPATGPAGNDGDSAYDLWKDMISDGTADDPHNDDPNVKWPAANNSEEWFWVYLTGTDGESAYELWVKDVEEGLEDPHNPGSDWPENQTDRNDFYDYLTGADGQSAYDIWVKDVKDSNGLADPHNPGNNWPKEETNMDDFYEYLRGEDGEDGADGAPGVPGAPGTEPEPIEGRYNVLAQYSNLDFSEFVSTTDGSVTYIVYGKNGDIAPGAMVTAMPGVAESHFPKTADGAGKITLERDELPTGGPAANRYGSSIVNNEASAPNTYVPEQIDIRLRFVNMTLDDGYVKLDLTVERKVQADGEWQTIPSYLDRLSDQQLSFYKMASNLDTDYEGAEIWETDDIDNISASSFTTLMTRPRVGSPDIRDNWESANSYRYDGGDWGAWGDNKAQYFVVTIDEYYGVERQLVHSGTTDRKLVLQRVPIQRVPLISNPMYLRGTMSSPGYDMPSYYMSSRGSFDQSKIKTGHFYKSNTFNLQTAGEHYFMSPVNMDASEYNDADLFYVRFEGDLTDGSVGLSTSQQITYTTTNMAWTSSGNIFDGATATVVSADRNLFMGLEDSGELDFGTISFELTTQEIQLHSTIYEASTIVVNRE